jgi:tRNA A-37 threonylcarbamoyl transferase component Bud32
VFPDFIQHKSGNAAIWIDRRFADKHFIERLADADTLFAEPLASVVKDQKKIKVGRIKLQVAGAAHSLFIKRYNAFSLRYKLVSPLMRSGAFRALEGAAILQAADIPIAAPIAAVENRRRGSLIKSFFLSEEIVGGKTIDAYWRDELMNVVGREGRMLRRRFLNELAGLFATLHGRDIYHNDLKDANILAVADHSNRPLRLFLLDLEGVRRYKYLSPARRIKNLVQLNRTFGCYLRRVEKLIFVKKYLGEKFFERQGKRALIANVLIESERLDGVKSRQAGAGDFAIKASHG